MLSFFDLDLERHLGVEGHLIKISKLLKWYRFLHILKDVHSDLGPEGYNVLQMFKCLLLQSWHSLSDSGLEHSLRVRLDFMQFTGFSVGDSLPDETTFCRFRNKLVSSGKYEKLLVEVNRQLEKHGLKVEHAAEAIVDATIITSNAHPFQVVDVDEKGDVQEESSADPDATWKKKGSKSYYGYQGFARCDEEGFIDKTHVTPANKSELGELETMTKGLKKGTRLRTDKGFFSAENKEMLRQKGLKSGLMYRAYRNRPLTRLMKKFNKLISQTRWRVEQCFGTIKRRFSFKRASYFTTEKVAAQFTMKAICLNLLKAVNKVQIA